MASWVVLLVSAIRDVGCGLRLEMFTVGVLLVKMEGKDLKERGKTLDRPVRCIKIDVAQNNWNMLTRRKPNRIRNC